MPTLNNPFKRATKEEDSECPVLFSENNQGNASWLHTSPLKHLKKIFLKEISLK